jgi:hypothetical protein
MKTAALQTTVTSDLDVFRARCEALAQLVREGRAEFLDAVDALQNMAVAYGLVADIGQDRVQAAIAAAFTEVSS